MAGFLTHLVQRTLAASPVLAPRLSGRYEASSEGSEPPLATDVTRARDTFAPLPASARGQTTPASTGIREEAPEDARVLAHDSREQMPERPQMDSGVLFEPLQAAVTPRVEVPPALHTIPHDGLVPARRETPPQPTSEAAVHAPKAAGDDALPSQPSQSLAPSQPHEVEAYLVRRAGTSAEPTPAPEVNTTRFDLIPSVDPSPQPASQRHSNQAGILLEPRLRLEQDPAHQPAQAPAAPTVHVTIGRIELRAAAPAAASAPSRHPAKAPTLSLSDYLERRAKGGSG